MAISKIRVAIIGGGLTGTILMNVLTKYTHLDVQLYEGKSEITERGASIGLAGNARRALELIGLPDVVKKAHGVRVGSSLLIMGEGPDMGKVIRDIDFDTQTVHRAALLRELLRSIPESSIHLGKQLSSIRGSSVSFADGTSIDADVIIGADGIRSKVREFILGEGHPAIEPVSACHWDARAVMSLSEAAAKLGTSCINQNDPRQHMHIGKNGIIFHDIIDDAQRVCIALSGPMPDNWDKSQWHHTITRKWLDEQYAGWGDFGQNGLDLLCSGKEEVSAFAQWQSAEPPKLYNDTMCMVGDAGHASSPWLGSGLSQAIEDSLILEKLLGRCTTVQEVPLALEAYDQVRRVHAYSVVKSSRETAESYWAFYELGVEELRKRIPSRDYVLNWDTEGAIQRAFDIFEQLKEAQEL